MSKNRYTEAHLNPNGPGDARPTALQVVKDEGLEGKLTDKVFLVTGVSSGIGIETVKALAATGAVVYGTVRNLEKGRQALGSVLSPGRVELLHCDLSSLASVRVCAEEFLKKSKKLNVLIANAGVMAIQTLTKTVDGFEEQFATNHLAHFLLFQLLKPTMLASSSPDFQSRVVMLSSSGHRSNGVIFDDINFDTPDSYSPFVAYGQSKSANIYMASYIERHYGKRGLHGLAVHPGGIWSGLGAHLPEEQMAYLKSDQALAKIMKTPEQGAATSVLAALGKEFEGRGKVYLEDSGEWGPAEEGAPSTDRGYAKHAFDEVAEDRLWRVSNQLVGIKEE
ncbi:hypothetical protein F5884DRAFT_897237 [Xylogone sp. PMI_703]|nr:hypothetical protein F5884DRAFT_897237 [Xylogone sp. PMI_703]